jgi:hypothetical protein
MFYVFIAISTSIPVILILAYGEDENADFFKKGKGVTDQFITIYKKVPYHLGVMVSEPAAIAGVSIVLIFILWICYEAVRLSKLVKSKSKWNSRVNTNGVIIQMAKQEVYVLVALWWRH